MYLHKNLCYTDATQFYAALAAECAPTTNTGAALLCTPISTGYSIKIGTAAAINVVPISIDCTPEITSALTLSGAASTLLIAAFCIAILRKVVK